MMEIDKSKLFVGGISRETSEDALRAHFSKYGTVSGSLVAKDRLTKAPRGFGFVWFSDPTFADKALQDSHVILGRTVEVKKAILRSEQMHFQHHPQHHQLPNHQTNGGVSENSSNGNGNGNDNFRTKKIFVGGLASSLTEEQFKNYFERFGEIVDVVVMQDSSTNRPRGFGFVTFDSEESVDSVMLNTFHELNGRLVEVKRAVPKGGLNGSNNRYNTKGGVRGSSTKNFQSENYLAHGPGREILPGYAPFPGYGGVGGGYVYGTGVYGGYPMVGYGRPGFSVTTVGPRILWNGPVMTGAPMYPPYNNAFIYPTHMNSGVSFTGMMIGGQGGFVGSSGNVKLNEVSCSNGPLLPEASLPPTGDLKSGVDSSSGTSS